MTAKQVRGVHATTRARLSTAGNDTPQTRTAQGDNNEGSAPSRPIDSPRDGPVEEKPWWRKALNHVASLGAHNDPSTSTEPKSESSPPPRHHAKNQGRSEAHPYEANGATDQDERGPTYGFVRFTATGNQLKTHRRERKSAKRRQGHVSIAQQTDVAAMRQQIQQLAEQVKALQTRLEANPTKGQLSSSPTSAAVRATPMKKTQATLFKPQSLDPALQTLNERRILPSSEITSSEIIILLDAARDAYKRTFYNCLRTAWFFAKSRSDLITPIAPSILRHFLTAQRLTTLDDVSLVGNICAKYQRLMGGLASKLSQSSSEALSHVNSLVASDVAKYAKTQLFGDPVALLLEVCHQRRVESAQYIQNISKELEECETPMLTLVAGNFRKHIEAMADRASEEGDIRLLRGLGDINDPRNVLTRPDKEVKAPVVEGTDDGQRLMRQIHTQSRSMTSSTDLRVDSEDGSHEASRAKDGPEAKQDVSSDDSSKSLLPNEEVSEQSLLEELFPEANSAPPPRPTEKSRDQYPRLELPKSAIRPETVGGRRKVEKRATEPFQQQREQIAVLQLTHCSTGLTEADFRRIIPKGKHLEGWRRDSDFYKVIPGRDPMSLERLPFYYVLFKNTEAALAYQKNASRLHKLSGRYQPSSILSAIPPPKGFLEDGEDIGAAVASYNLLPKDHAMSLNVLMQPYSPALRLLVERGGYQPIASGVDEKGNRIWRVLLHIEGYEPSASDIYIAICTDAYRQGSLVPLRNEAQSSIHRLRDMINLKMSGKPISTSRPRAYGTFDYSASTLVDAASSSSSSSMEMTYDDPEIQSMMGNMEEDRSAAQMHQEVMNRVYNRWVLDFEDEHSARRWCLRWHRKVFPEPSGGDSSWKDSEEVRLCNAEVLW